MKSKRIITLFSLLIFTSTLTACYHQRNITRLEYPSPIPVRLGKHDFSAQSSYILSPVSKQIARVAERNLYERMKCTELRGPRKDSPILCYEKKDQPGHIVYSHDTEKNRFVIMISWFGDRDDSSILQVRDELEKVLEPILGNPLGHSP